MCLIMELACATLCLSSSPSPRGAKARRGTSKRRETGCGECSNRWAESSVLVRYAHFIPALIPLSLSLSLSRLSHHALVHYFPSHFSINLLFHSFSFPFPSFQRLPFFSSSPCPHLIPSIPHITLSISLSTFCPNPHQHSAFYDYTAV